MIVESFTDIAHRIVWCTLATVDRHGRPRSRVVHPVWETTDDVVIGWVWTRPTPLKRAHLRHHPFVSCTYWDPQHDVAVAECDARWEMDSAERERVWGLVATPAHHWAGIRRRSSRAALPTGRPACCGSIRGGCPCTRPRTWPPVGGPRCGSRPESTRRTKWR